MERPIAWKAYDDAAMAELEKISSDYRAYLDNGKTERECAAETVAIAKEAGYTDLKAAIRNGSAVKPGDKL